VRTIARGGWLHGLGLLVAACSPADEFPCDADAQCLDHGIAGVCQEPGWCSFPDDACPSGQRFGDHAGDGLARTCVPDGGTSTDGPSTTLTGATTLDTTDPSTVSLSETTPVTVGEETADEVTSLTGNDETTSLSSTDPDTTPTETSTTDPTGNEETTGEPDPCPTYVDDFEDGVIGDEWEISYPDYVHDVQGARIFEITAEDDDIYPATRLAAGQDLTDGWIRAQVGHTLRLISTDDIVYLRSDSKYTLIAWNGDDGKPAEALVRTPLRELAARLDPAQFAQVHRSTVVNLRAIDHVRRGDNETADIHLKGRAEVLPVSRNYLHLFKQM